MKKIIELTLILIIIYFSMQIAFNFFNKNQLNTYIIKDNQDVFEITEEYMSNDKNFDDNYFISVKHNGIEYNYELYNDFHKNTNIIDKIKKYSDSEYECIFIGLKDSSVINEVKCYNGEYVIPYHLIINPPEELKKFIIDLKQEGYDENNFISNDEKKYSLENATIYLNNINKNTYLGINLENKLYKLNKIDKISIKNIASNNTYVFLKDKFIGIDKSANYIQLLLYSLTNSSHEKVITHLKTNEYIYIGSYNNKLYFYGVNDKVEYEFNIKNNKLLIVNTENYDIKFFENGKWNFKNISDVDIKNINFGSLYEEIDNQTYDKAIKFNKPASYTYYYDKNDTGYNVYRSNNNGTKMYLFNTSDYNSIKFYNEYIYYIKNNELRFFSDLSGDKLVGSYNENIPLNSYNVYYEK